jgi:3-methyladenine DNA glycosylase AlkD
MTLASLKQDLRRQANPDKKKVMQSFFKTGDGEYGYGDIFLGVSVPQQRLLVKQYAHLSLDDIKKLLYSTIHEERFCAIILLTKHYQKQPEKTYRFYLTHAKQVNNWDLVDASAPHIVGQYLLERKKEREVLYKLATASNLWEKRISIVATQTLIKHQEYEETVKLCKVLMSDSHDLIHKACGWMLREVGKYCSQDILEQFLNEHKSMMPRTMLRYAIERFPEEKRKEFLRK